MARAPAPPAGTAAVGAADASVAGTEPAGWSSPIGAALAPSGSDAVAAPSPLAGSGSPSAGGHGASRSTGAPVPAARMIYIQRMPYMEKMIL